MSARDNAIDFLREYGLESLIVMFMVFLGSVSLFLPKEGTLDQV